MAAPLLDRFGFGNARAVANARQDALRRAAEERMVAELVEGIRRRELTVRSRLEVRADRAA